MHLRVQIPARDEAATLEGVARGALQVLDQLCREGAIERGTLLVIDDASSDGTGAIAERLAGEDARVQVVSTTVSAGVGRAFRVGVARALEESVDVLVNLDADGQFDPSDVRTVARPVLDSAADLVSASRFLGIVPSPPMPLARWVGNRGLALLVSCLAARSLSDASCGLRAFSRRAMSTMTLREDFTYTQETLLQCAWAGLVMRELPVPVKGVRPSGRSRVAKSVLRYGWRVSGILIRAFARRDQHRLLAPAAELVRDRIRS